jgi:predicted esterase
MLWHVAVALALTLGGAACSRGATSGVQEPQVAPQASTGATHPEPTPAATAPEAPAPAAPTIGVTPTPWPPPPPTAQSDFCIEGIDALDPSSCYVLPDSPTDELLIYLHGIVPPTKSSHQKTNFQTVVKVASRRANVAALMPRGRVGLAPKGQERWWGWPTARASYRSLAPELITEMIDQRRRLEELTGRPFRRVYLAGSSSGAYFVTALAVMQALPVDGYGIISGGADRPDVDLTQLPRTPVYIGFGTYDTVGNAARALGVRLARAGLPVKVGAHPRSHGTAEVYLDEAFAHFRASRSD